VQYKSSSPLSGRVLISGARFGLDRSASVPVQDVPVALLASNGALLGLTMSNANGMYTFHDVPSQSNLTLQLLQDGILRQALRSSGDFLRAEQYDILGINSVTGPPQALSNSTFKLLLDNTEQPVYSIPSQSSLYLGNSKSLAYWQFQMSGYGELDGDYTASQMGALRTQASTLLLSFASCPVSITSSDALESNLFAAALNTVSGRGFFAPYRALQEWMIGFAQHIFCSGVQDSTDRNIAIQFMQQINSATDAASA